jgi:hypothetical protein
LVANWMAPGDLLVYECPADTSSRFFWLVLLKIN